MKYFLSIVLMLVSFSVFAEEALISYDRALVQVLDKKKSKAVQVELKVGEQMLFEDLQFDVKACQEKGEHSDDFWFFVQIEDKQKEFETEEVSRIFSGWMTSKSPSLSSLEHIVYDIQLIKCFSSSLNPNHAEKLSD